MLRDVSKGKVVVCIETLSAKTMKNMKTTVFLGINHDKPWLSCAFWLILHDFVLLIFVLQNRPIIRLDYVAQTWTWRHAKALVRWCEPVGGLEAHKTHQKTPRWMLLEALLWRFHLSHSKALASKSPSFNQDKNSRWETWNRRNAKKVGSFWGWELDFWVFLWFSEFVLRVWFSRVFLWNSHGFPEVMHQFVLLFCCSGWLSTFETSFASLLHVCKCWTFGFNMI